jgi:hypothetical protein
MKKSSPPCPSSWAIVGFLLAALAVPVARADTVMYGSLGGHNNGDSANDGGLALVNPATGAVTVIGQPQGVARLGGIAFESTGRLFASTIDAGMFPPPVPFPRTSELILLDRNTGALITNIGRIKDSTGQAMSISRIAIQPGTDRLFAVRSPNDETDQFGKLYTVDKTTGVATPVGGPGSFFGAITFAPNGTLYKTAADLDFATDTLINQRLETLDPNTGQILSTVRMVDYLPGLGVRPEDGVLFASNGDLSSLFTINPVTGAETLIGTTGNRFVSSLAFGPAPVSEPGALGLLALGILGMLSYSWRRKRIA